MLPALLSILSNTIHIILYMHILSLVSKHHATAIPVEISPVWIFWEALTPWHHEFSVSQSTEFSLSQLIDRQS